MDHRYEPTRALRVAGLQVLACLAGTSPVFASGADVVALAKDYPIQLAIVILACLGIGALGAALRQQQMAGYVAALVATAAMLPGAAALTTVIMYLAEWKVRFAPIWGSAIAMGAWLVAAILCRGFAEARNAIPSSYGELRHRLDQLDAGLKVVCSAKELPNEPCKTIACHEAKDQKDQIEKDCNRRGIEWALGRGYINVWERLHRAEEALIEVSPQETVLAGAFYDELRLQGSKIDNCDDLLTRLRKAVNVLEPAASKYLKTSASVTAPLVITTPSPLADGRLTVAYSQEMTATGGTPPYSWSVNSSDVPDGLGLSSTGVLSGIPTKEKTSNLTVRVTDSANLMAEKLLTLTIHPQPQQQQMPAQVVPPIAGAAPQEGNTEPKTLARAVLRTVRRSINEFRDSRWNGLIVARNRLLATMIFTGLTAYALLAIAIISGAERSTVVAASAFYLVGAIVGLCGRLRGESQTEAAVEDYGLSSARLITIPLFSGLAAIGGVVFVAMLPFASTVFGPTTPAASPLAISTDSPLPQGIEATAHCQPLQATGGTSPYTWTVSEGPLPGGLTLSAAGLLSGAPTKAGPSKFTVQVADSAGASVKKSFNLPINPRGQAPSPLAISTTSPLPEGTVAAVYCQPLQATGGTTPYGWTLSGGALPGGVALSPAGVLSGAPTNAGSGKFTVQVADSAGVSAKSKKDFRLPIVQPGQSTGAPAVGAAPKPPAGARAPTLEEVFDLNKNLVALFVAAVFGLTPGLLFDRLQQQAEKYKADLRSSQATQGTRPT